MWYYTIFTEGISTLNQLLLENRTMFLELCVHVTKDCVISTTHMHARGRVSNVNLQILVLISPSRSFPLPKIISLSGCGRRRKRYSD